MSMTKNLKRKYLKLKIIIYLKNYEIEIKLE